MSHVFHRALNPIMVESVQGCWVYDVDGKAYLDAAGGAVVSNVGHNAIEILEARRSANIDYVHPTVFTSESLEKYADDLASIVPIDQLRVFPTSGGAESVETAIKLARAHHTARGQAERDVIVSRNLSYHGNTLGALDLSGRPTLRGPYESWLGRSVQVPEVNEYRCPSPEHPDDCAGWHARILEDKFEAIGPGRVAAFIGEAIGGASTAAAIPPDGYWKAIAEVCRRHGVLLIVDEIMTGFGRTGRWFAIEESGVLPDIMVAGKGAAGGYWPLGLCMASRQVHDEVVNGGGFIHGFTFSHSPAGATVGRAVLEMLTDQNLVRTAGVQGEKLRGELYDATDDLATVGDIRGKGLLIGIEFVADRQTRRPFPRAERFVERVTAAAREHGLLVYPSTGCVDGTEGDSILLGPPFTISDEEIATLTQRLRAALQAVAQ